MKIYLKINHIFLFTTLLLILSCNKDMSVNNNSTIPKNKLPWPHQYPDLEQEQYEQLIDDLWIINNFGQYQGGDTKESIYFHDGIDVVLENGTNIFAIDSGYVRYINDVDPNYSTIIIEDKNNPNYAWAYTHVYYFNVEVGDYVPQGTHIADINFQGLGHIHLSRITIQNNGSWENIFDWYYINPDSSFIFYDTQPPVIENPFYYFCNNSDSLISNNDSTFVNGDIDIVVGIRDQGEYAHSKVSFYGDRLCITRLDYEISSDLIETVYKESFDFSKIQFKRHPTLGIRDYEKISTVYRFYYTIHPEGPENWDKIFSYYNITNASGIYENGLIDPSDCDYSWDTDSISDTGTPNFPNGKYTITVTAYDFKGNSTSVSDEVFVRN